MHWMQYIYFFWEVKKRPFLQNSEWKTNKQDLQDVFVEITGAIEATGQHFEGLQKSFWRIKRMQEYEDSPVV